MIFISKVVLTAFLSPSCIHILLSLFVGLIIPQFSSFPILDIFVFVSGVVLLGCQNKACVDNLALVEDQSLCIELIDKLLE